MPDTDELLLTLDGIARDHDHYEYGLPLDIADEDEDGPTAKMRAAVNAFAQRIREDERERCAKLIESTIRQGQLQGTGWDALAQRNGQILACNVIRTGRPETASAIRRGGDHADQA